MYLVSTRVCRPASSLSSRNPMRGIVDVTEAGLASVRLLEASSVGAICVIVIDAHLPVARISLKHRFYFRARSSRTAQVRASFWSYGSQFGSARPPRSYRERCRCGQRRCAEFLRSTGGPAPHVNLIHAGMRDQV